MVSLARDCRELPPSTQPHITHTHNHSSICVSVRLNGSFLNVKPCSVSGVLTRTQPERNQAAVLFSVPGLQSGCSERFSLDLCQSPDFVSQCQIPLQRWTTLPWQYMIGYNVTIDTCAGDSPEQVGHKSPQSYTALAQASVSTCWERW